MRTAGNKPEQSISQHSDSFISAAPTVSESPEKMEPAAAAAAVAVLERVCPLGPASSAGWRLPTWARLRGGGEGTGGTGGGGWGAPPPASAAAAPGTANWAQNAASGPQWARAGNGGPAPPGAQAPPPQPPGPGSAGKPGSVGQQEGPPSGSPSPAQQLGHRNSQERAEGPPAPTGGGADTSDLERLKAMRAAITATEGWSSSQVNQESGWDMPTSPEPSDRDPSNVVAWKLPGVNNGLEVWQATMRNGGAPPPVKPVENQWPHHIPQSNHGGTWGEDDDNNQPGGMWTGGPSGPGGGQWGGPAGGPGAGGAMWAGPGAKKDDWGSGAKHWDNRAPNGDGWGNKPPSQWGGPPQHGGPGQWGDDRSPPMARRPMGFDDWGNKRGGPGGGAGWKELPGGAVRPGMPGGPPAPHMLSRMPPGGADPHKGVDPWGRPPRAAGWGEAPPGSWGEEKWGGDGPGGWGGKPKTPTGGVPGGWGDPEMEWAAKGRGPGAHPSKAAIYEKSRMMAEHGFKPEDMEPMLRQNMMLSLEEAVDPLRPGPGGDWHAGDHSGGLDPGFSQLPPPHGPYGAGLPLPAQGAPNAGNINPAVIQQLLRQQAQQPPSRFPGQQPQASHSARQLQPLIHQIQMAVHAGHLNPAILQQPMGPQTLILLNGLLAQIKHLDQLSRQAHLARGHHGNSPHLQTLQMEMMRAKNTISNIQSQIASQQTMMLKQQQQQQQQPPQSVMSAGGGGNPLMYKQPGPGDLHNLPANLGELSLREGVQQPQSRLSQWKLPTADKLEEFSRAPGAGSKSAGSPPMSLMSDSAWSSSRGGRDGGWPEGGAPTPAPAAVDRHGDKVWPDSPGGGHSYADLVPEFEPGKPWKMKASEEEAGLTPGGARGPVSVGSAGSPQDLLNMQTGKNSPPGASSDGFGSSTWSFNPSSGKPGMASGKSWDGVADWGVKSPRGPPPGLNKAGWAGVPTSGSVISGRGSGGGGQYDQRSAFAQVPGAGWSGGGSGSGGSTGGTSAWLLLRNLTAQIDGSTLKTLCMQHGPLFTFHMYLSQGVALVKYSSREEAAKAQGALNNCVLSNTTIMAEAVSDEHAAQLLQQLGLPGAQPSAPFAQTPPSSSGAGAPPASKPPASAAWSDMADMGAGGGGSMAWSSGTGGSSSLWAAPGLEEGGRGPYLPDGLL